MARWIPEVALRTIHSQLMAEHGGLVGASNDDALRATLGRPLQLENYNTSASLFELAASYGFGFAKNHCFSDGNKRVALASIDVFLQLNGQELIASEEDAVLTIEALAAGTISENELTIWIAANTQILSES